jgi:hypothetical protein
LNKTKKDKEINDLKEEIVKLKENIEIIQSYTKPSGEGGGGGVSLEQFNALRNRLKESEKEKGN